MSNNTENKLPKHYLIKLNVQCGEYEKTATHFLKAYSEKQACLFAINNESHDPEGLDLVNEKYWYDLGGEFAYSISSCEEITDPLEIEVLEKYL